MMYIDRHHIKFLVPALVSLTIGLGLLTQSSELAIRGVFIQLPALLLVVYGLIVAWWHTKRAVSVFEVQAARAVHRALHRSSGRSH
jgi:hypothetical protein